MSRTYKDDYLQYGFALLKKGNIHYPKCVICCKVLANESMKPYKLKAHLISAHPEHAGHLTTQKKEQALQKMEFFKRKAREEIKSEAILQKVICPSRSLVKASYLVAQKVAQSKKPYTIAAELILPCAKDMVREVIGDKESDKLGEIPLSARSITRRILEMGKNIAEQLYANLACEEFALQIDESTDVSNKALLLIFVRYKHGDDFLEDLLTCAELATRTTATETFAVMDKYITQQGLFWEKCVGICTDGAAAMTGIHSGLVRLIQTVSPKAKWIHCFLHREALAAKHMSAATEEVMDIAVKVINATRKSALNSRLFTELCKDEEAEKSTLLYFSAVRWLSRGDALSRLYELRAQVSTFLTEKNNPLADKFNDKCFLATLAYMADIFILLNELNESFQGKTKAESKNIFLMCDKIAAFKKKLDLWLVRCHQDQFDAFSNLFNFLSKEPNVTENIKAIVSEHLQRLRTKFDDYFPNDPSTTNEWIRDPFAHDMTGTDLPIPMQNELIELACDGSLKTIFMQKSLTQFWVQVAREYPEVGGVALRFLLPFSTTWMCEAGFSIVTYLKSKYRNRIETDTLCANLRIALSPLTVDIDRLVEHVQQQKSH